MRSGSDPSSGTLQKPPSYEATIAVPSGVNAKPGRMSSVARLSMSSLWTGYTSQRSSPVSRSLTRSPVASSWRVPYTSVEPSGEMAGRNPDP
jgi:hypothetical protein